MTTLLIILHVVACITLIAIVLLQTGRGAEMGASFGGSNQTLFGASSGTTFMGKLTTGAAVVFMLTCLSLTIFSGGPSTDSLMDNVEQGPVIPDATSVDTVPGQDAQAVPGQAPAAGDVAATPAPAQGESSAQVPKEWQPADAAQKDGAAATAPPAPAADSAAPAPAPKAEKPAASGKK